MSSTPSFEDRLRGAVWGQFVADAASLGTHWIYDLNDLAAQFPGGIRGFETPHPGHYHAGKQSGDFTHYGDAGLLLLESIAELGRFDERDFGNRFAHYFNDPKCPSYKDHATRDTLAHLAAQPSNYQNGADDDQPATPSRLAPVVVAYVKQSDEALYDAVKRCTLFAQNHPTALDCSKAHASVLRQLFLGDSLAQALEVTRAKVVNCDTSDLIEAALTLQNADVTQATLHFGQSCPLPKSFPAAIHAAVRHSTSYPDAVLATIKAGGDNAARATYLGAWLGALHGVQGIPEDWINKLTAKERISTALDKLVRRL